MNSTCEHLENTSKTHSNVAIISGRISETAKSDLTTVRLMAHAICRNFLEGVWTSIDVSQLKIVRMTGGLTNYLYKCEVSVDDESKEPEAVLLRLYGENHDDAWTTIKDVFVSSKMGDHQLGPRILGIFEGGRLEEFINARNVNRDIVSRPETSRCLAGVMARFHLLHMPFAKETTWLFDLTERYINTSKELQFLNERDTQLFAKLMSLKLDQEFQLLKPILEGLRSPIVFCHNDVNMGNVLALSAEKLMLIDYEFASYNYRGFDIGNHFSSWTMNNNHHEYPFFRFTYEHFPTRDQQVNFAKAYLKTRAAVSRHASVDEDSDEAESQKRPLAASVAEVNDEDVERLLVEANHFALAANIIWAFWGVCQAVSYQIDFSFLDYALARCDGYFKHKAVLYPNGF